MAVPSQPPAVSSTAVPNNSTSSEVEKKKANTNNMNNTITPTPKLKFHLLTAYSDNYAKIGDLCAKVNEKYAEKHENCIFEAVVDSHENMMEVVGARNHTTWYKIKLFIDKLKEKLSAEENHKMTEKIDDQNSQTLEYLVWLDADAAIIDFSKKMDEIVTLGEFRELVMGEDMHAGGNLINCGVFFVKVCDWSLKLFEEVWDLQIKKRGGGRGYIDVCFYEQSALGRVLKKRKAFKEFFEATKKVENDGESTGDKSLTENNSIKENPEEISDNKPPRLQDPADFARFATHKKNNERMWHSFTYKKSNPLHYSAKIFENVSILPMHIVNSNVMDWDLEYLATGHMPKGTTHHPNSGGKNYHEPCEFIFHAAGLRGKTELISGMLQRRGISGLIADDSTGDDARKENVSLDEQ